MPVKIANYINICSNAMLSIIDNEYMELEDHTGVYNIPVNKQLKDLLYFHIKNLCKGYYQFGNNNIIVNSCLPENNWRLKNDENVPKYKYVLTNSDVFFINQEQFQYTLESIWKQLRKDLNKFIFMEHENLDCFDLNMIMQQCILDNVTLHPCNYYFLQDPNNDIVHDDNIPRWLNTDIEIQLRKHKLIL